MTVQTGLDRLLNENNLRDEFKGNIAYLCHSASVNAQLEHGLTSMQKVFGDRLVKVFSPQHGFVSDVQDNMVESDHYIHPHFNLKIYSLYSETRIPSPEMLDGIDHVFIDLQDVGTRIYTYIYTMTLLMKACINNNIEVIILDRPNPIGGVKLEGNILDMNYASFVGLHPLPVRHGMTMGEIAKMANSEWQDSCNLRVIEMKNWSREMFFEETKLPWVLPSPNLPTVDGCFAFVGTVLFEGTNISEGRGTSRGLEIVGHPKIEPFSFLAKLNTIFEKENLKGFKLRPVSFIPTFQKHVGTQCGGYQIHPTDRTSFDSWLVSNIICREFYKELGKDFAWKNPPYEYEYDKEPIDMINGGPFLKEWIIRDGEISELKEMQEKDCLEFNKQRKPFLLY
jgi:uncharacterized protein YbbC (DUF1343 family)